MGPALRVVKVGGSLLELAELPQLWRAWREQQAPAVDVLLAGGGPFADAVREADAAHRLADSVAHELAIQCLGVTARLLAALLPAARLVGRLHDARAASVAAPPAPVVVDLWQCWQHSDAGSALRRLPASWAVTSDSLAAIVARELGAKELVLLKSADAPAAALPALAERGYVDAWFPQAAAGLSVRLVNLRKVAGTLRVP